MVCERQFGDTDSFKRWKAESFKKVVCRLNESEIAQAREAGDFAVVTESSLGDAVVALVFCPREEFPKAFRFFKLWR